MSFTPFNPKSDKYIFTLRGQGTRVKRARGQGDKWARGDRCVGATASRPLADKLNKSKVLSQDPTKIYLAIVTLLKRILE
jgi:hypothetical protein